MRSLVLKDSNIRKFFEEYPQYRTARISRYTKDEFLQIFGEEVGYWDYWSWTYGPEIYAELFYIQKGEHFEVLPHFAKSGSASSGESSMEPVGNVEALRNLLKNYHGPVIYVYYREERGGEKIYKEVIYTYLP